MTTMKRPLLSLLLLLHVTVAFLPPLTFTTRNTARAILFSTQDDNDNEPDELVLGNALLEDQMKSLRTKFPTTEADYLAAARKRAEEARASMNSAASDEEWMAMAAQQQQKQGNDDDDDWESSLQDQAGNEESQILIPKVETNDEEDGEDDEPKLLLL